MSENENQGGQFALERIYVKDLSFEVPSSKVFLGEWKPEMNVNLNTETQRIGDSHFELEFASFLEDCEDIISYVKNYFAVHFKIDYRNADGSISDYYPDFIVKVSPKEYYVVETKGCEDLDDVEKIKRLEQWCEDVNANQKNMKYRMLYIKQEDWEGLGQKPRNFGEVVRGWNK